WFGLAGISSSFDRGSERPPYPRREKHEEIDSFPAFVWCRRPATLPAKRWPALTSGGEGLQNLAETVVHQLNFEHPEWLSAFGAIGARGLAGGAGQDESGGGRRPVHEREHGGVEPVEDLPQARGPVAHRAGRQPCGA